MAATAETSPVLRIIDENHQKFVADPDYAKGLRALDHKKLREATNGLRERIANFANYYVFLRNMKTMKIIKGTLSEDAEKALVTRGRDALNVFERVSSSV